jgi:hypothetical protein
MGLRANLLKIGTILTYICPFVNSLKSVSPLLTKSKMKNAQTCDSLQLTLLKLINTVDLANDNDGIFELFTLYLQLSTCSRPNPVLKSFSN